MISGSTNPKMSYDSETCVKAKDYLEPLEPTPVPSSATSASVPTMLVTRTPSSKTTEVPQNHRIAGIIVLTVFLFIATIFKTRQDKREKPAITKPIESWKVTVLIIAHIGAGLWSLLLSLIGVDVTLHPSYGGYVLLLTSVPFCFITVMILYNLLKHKKLLEKYLYFNIALCAFCALFSAFWYPFADPFASDAYLVDPFASFVAAAILISVPLSIPNIASLVTIRNYGRELTIKGKEVGTSPPSQKITIKRGYVTLPNNNIKFGIKVFNDTPYVASKVEVILDYPEEVLSLKEPDSKNYSLGSIFPGAYRTAEYILTPLGCVHREEINALITYRDATGNRHTVQMRSKEVHCVCPFLKEKPMREGEFAELATKSKHIEEGLSFSGIRPSEIAAFTKESCTHRLHTVGEHEIDNTIILNLAGESIGEDAYYLLTAVIQPYKEKDMIQIALRAYSDKPHGLHGFLNEITASIRHLVGSVQSAKEIGIIENKQVINIIDSVVQRTTFAGGVGEEISATGVDIEGSVLQRSQIGSTQRCPNCGVEVSADEKFCTECGTRLG